MAADPSSAVTVWEAVQFLAPLVGTGGITAIAVAWYGSRRPHAPKPDSSAAPQQVGIQALLADHYAMERLIVALNRGADAIEDGAKAMNRLADMADIARAVERLRAHD